MKSRNVTFVENYSFVAYKSSSKGRAFVSESKRVILALCERPFTGQTVLLRSQFAGTGSIQMHSWVSFSAGVSGWVRTTRSRWF